MPLPINTDSLVNEMRATLFEIEKQIAAAKRDVLNHLPVHQEPDPNEVYKWKDNTGRFLLTDLLVAKAQILSSLATLQASAAKR